MLRILVLAVAVYPKSPRGLVWLDSSDIADEFIDTPISSLSLALEYAHHLPRVTAETVIDARNGAELSWGGKASLPHVSSSGLKLEALKDSSGLCIT